MWLVSDAFLLWQKTRKKGEKGTSLRLRLFSFFAFFVFAIGMAFLLLMMVFGVFDSGVKESRIWMESELEHLMIDMGTDFGKLSLQGVSLTEQIVENMELYLQKNDMQADELQAYPERLEEILAGQMPMLVSALTYNKCSGAFIILDATVNPDLEGAESSKAGIFLKRTEPNAVNMVHSKIHYLRGPASIARDYGVELLGQWQMEFETKGEDFYQTTLLTARENGRLPLSRLYFWSDRVLLQNNSESGMLLCLPLISKDGIVYGICGMEVSSMLFKQQYSPDNTTYSRIFAALSPRKGDAYDMDAGLVAGNSYLASPATGKITEIKDGNSVFSSFHTEEGQIYGGLNHIIQLYPSGSAYENQKWMVAVMMPDEDFTDVIRGKNLVLYGAVTSLMFLSLMVAAFISKRYITPVLEALALIKSEDYSGLPKTRYLEINDLLEYLAAQDELKAAQRKAELPVRNPEQSLPNLSAYEEFVQNINTLSTAEKAVFNLYMEGHTAKEITEILCLSMNTIKTHNKRIYTKLNVTSRKELMVYVQMMTDEEKGRRGGQE